jgi:hypothetical protein
MSQWKYIGIILLLGLLNLRLLFFVHQQPIEENQQVGTLQQEYISNLDFDALGIEKPIQGVQLIALISDAGCVETIQQEVNLLNQIASTFPTYVRVFYDSSSDSYFVRLFNATFEHAQYRSDMSGQNHPTNDPMAFLIDSKGTVLWTHFSDRKNPKVSESFYARMGSLLESLQ